MKIIELIKRELRLIAGEKSILLIILAAPVFYSIFYGTLYINKTQTEILVTVVDMDRSHRSEELIRDIDIHKKMEVRHIAPGITEGKEDIYSFRSHGLVYIPEGYGVDLKSGRQAQLKLYLNTTRFLVANDINLAMTEIISDRGLEVRTEVLMKNGYARGQAERMSEPLVGDIRSLFNSSNTYGAFLLPGMLVLILQQTLLIGLATSMAKERETGSLKEFLGGTNNMFSTVAGKGVFYFILFATYALLFYTVEYAFLKIPFRGNAAALALFTIIFLFAVTAFSIFTGSFFKNRVFSLQVTAMSSYPFFLISGYSFPPEAMPWFMNALASIIPSTPYFRAVIRITQMGADLHHILPELAHLLILALLFFAAAVIRLVLLKRRNSAERKNNPLPAEN